jgi:transglutaminase-like putative cysteine protease
VLAAVSTALLPLVRVVEPGPWLVGSVAIIVLVLTAGYVARRFGLPPLVVSLIGIGVWVITVTAVFARGTALLGIIPMPATFRDVPLLIDAAMIQVRDGAAPLLAGMPLSFMIVAAAGLLAIAIDHVVVTARMPLLAIIALITVYLIPAIAVPQSIDVGTFIAFAAGLLLLLGVETATRDRGTDRTRNTGTRRGTAVTAVGVGAAALVAAIVATPALPAPVLGGTSVVVVRGNAIDPSLDLGRDLRQPQDISVLEVRGDAPSVPYLRAVTLSRFDGETWAPDRGITESRDEEFEPLAIDPDVPVVTYNATVQIVNYVSPWLPVPYPAVELDGLDGDWAVLPQNRTVVARSTSPQGQEYEVTYEVPRPSAERIRSSEAAIDSDSRTLDLPDDPAVAAIREQALAVTSATSTDYDALIAMQRWFRGLEFEYSLDAPVQAGFDGSGLEAVREFLDVKRGYCVHFASAFAIMARTLDMPARIVVGYLPGTPTSESIDDQRVHEVSSSQLHAWPEVHFEGIGWIPFEPTNSLGVPTSFASSTTPGTPGGLGAGETAPPPSQAPAPSTAPGETDATDDSGAAAGNTRVNPTPPIATALAVLVLLVLPGSWRAVRRRRRLGAARAGDAAAAWAEASDTAVDLGVALPRGESPRALGRRLVDDEGADAAAMALLVAAIERASYAPPVGTGTRRSDEALDEAVRVVRAGMLSAVDRRARLAATLAPRSLFGRRAAEARAAR